MTPLGKYNFESSENILNGLTVPSGKGKEAVWNTIFEKLEKGEQKPVISIWRKVSQIAAIIIGLVVIGNIIWAMLLSNSNFYSPKGEHLLVVLPDSSEVTLNADSYLNYNKAFWKYSRKVTLKGEALFKVKKGKQFRVVTGPVTTQVLGTIFNVFARNNNVQVSCLEGRVEVKHSKTLQKFVLEPEQKISSAGNRIVEPKKDDTAQIAKWVNGEFYFNKTELKDVFAELERQYNINIELYTGQNRLYSGVFFKNDLTQALDLVCIPMSLIWQQKGNIIEISPQSN